LQVSDTRTALDDAAVESLEDAVMSLEERDDISEVFARLSAVEVAA
jgi:hypothetical protein